MSGIWKRKKRSDIQTPTARKGRKQLRLNLPPPRQISTLPAVRLRSAAGPGVAEKTWHETMSRIVQSEQFPIAVLFVAAARQHPFSER